MERYAYRDTQGTLTYEMSGDRVIYRGRQILGLRSNIVKATFFDTVRGTILSKKGVVEFSASDAEWDTSSSSPLILHRNVNITVNHRRLDNLKQARIYFKRGVLEVSGKQKEVFQLM
ncbi:MAG: hypothetical protein HXX11_21155 [Desulfuromonadales bacterium]|nr:hypothetical protein [Desulfuromonadales bacterium]